MMRVVYQAMSRTFAVVLLVVGVGLLIGGSYAHSYVSDQLSQEKITMPSGDSLKTADMQKYLSPYAGQQMTTGPQAQAFANHYIHAHMNAASDNKTYEEVSGEYIACSSNDATKTSDSCVALGQLRQTLFMGDSLRGMLLTAYAWWLVGTIAIWAGVAALVLAVVLAGLGWFVLKPRAAVAEATAEEALPSEK
jgi:hypothetical protein